MPFLKRASGEQAGQCIELKGDQFVIGRSPECDLVLDPNGVSRRHARFYRGPEGYYLADLNSRNKTKLNNIDMDPKKDHRLRSGDRISICDVEFVYLSKLPVADDARSDIILTDGRDESTLHTMDASTFDPVGSKVDPALKLKAILDITRNLSSMLQTDAVAPKVLDSLFDVFPMSERAFLILKDPKTGRLIRKAFKHRAARVGRRPLGTLSYDDEVPIRISSSIVNHVLDHKKAVLSQDAGNDSNLPISASIADLKIHSVMCAPLLTPNGEALGIIQLDTTAARQFSEDDLDVLTAVACQAAISIQNARMHEDMMKEETIRRDLRLAEQVQRSFLPSHVPKIPGYEFFAYYNAAFEVGGDYYDFVKLPGHRLAVALGDVAGKGVAAALMMAKLSGDARSCLLTQTSPAEAVAALNELLCASGLEERFITLSMGFLDLESGRLTLASAGHLPVMIRRSTGEVDVIKDGLDGLPLGITNEFDYGEVEVQLHKGDVAVVYSDGVIDSRNLNDELYDTPDEPRLLRRVKESVGGPEAVGKALLQEIREYSAGQKQFDDLTLVCFGRV